VKILDYTQASYQVALLGAEVIKVERRMERDIRRNP